MMEKFLGPVIAGVLVAALVPGLAWYAIGVLLSVVLLSFCYISIKSRKNRSYASSGANTVAFLAIVAICGSCAISILLTMIVLNLVK